MWSWLRVYTMQVQYMCIAYKLYNIHINRLASLKGRPNTSEKQPYITPKSNWSKEKKTLAGPIYIQNPVNGRFWPNLGFRNVGSWTARNLKFGLQHDWCLTRRSSKFQVNCSSTSWDIKHWNLHFPEPILRCMNYILISLQAYRGDQIHRKTALHNPQVKSK